MFYGLNNAKHGKNIVNMLKKTQQCGFESYSNDISIILMFADNKLS